MHSASIFPNRSDLAPYDRELGGPEAAMASNPASNVWTQYPSSLAGSSGASTIYRQKETAEQSFDDLKNTQDVNRLRVHTEGRMEGKLFIAFISMIILSRIRTVSSKDASLRDRSMTELIREMKLLRRVDLNGRKSPR